MRYLVGLILVGLVSCQPSVEVADTPDTPDTLDMTEFLDPVKADGEHYALEFDNDYVRVLRENLAAGDGGAMHSHRDRVSVYLNDSEVTIKPRGGDPVDVTLVAGSTSWGEATTHQGFARGNIENLSIELWDLTGEEIPLPEPDAVEVDPEHHIVDFENDRVRVVRMIYPPGSKTPRHAHRTGFGVFLSDAHGQNILAEGEDAVEIEAKAGSTFWTAGQPEQPAHVTENLGDEDMVVVLVEFKKRPRSAPE